MIFHLGVGGFAPAPVAVVYALLAADRAAARAAAAAGDMVTVVGLLQLGTGFSDGEQWREMEFSFSRMAQSQYCRQRVSQSAAFLVFGPPDLGLSECRQVWLLLQVDDELETALCLSPEPERALTRLLQLCCVWGIFLLLISVCTPP